MSLGLKGLKKMEEELIEMDQAVLQKINQAKQSLQRLQEIALSRGVGRIFEMRGQMKYEYIITNGGGGGGMLCVLIH